MFIFIYCFFDFPGDSARNYFLITCNDFCFISV